jgi:hypothetical protein
MTITHSKVSAKADGADTTLVRPSDWNAAHVGNGLAVFNVMDYGAVADGVTDDGPAISAAYAAAVSASIYAFLPTTVWIPPGDYRIETTIIVQDRVRVIGYGSNLIGPITGFPVITTSTSAAGATDVAAQTGGACFTDAASSSTTLDELGFEGLHLIGFRWGFVSKCLSWSYALWQDCFFENCNVGIMAYQGAIGHRIIGTISGGGGAGTTYIAAATCFPSGHPMTGLDNYFCDGFVYDNTGGGRDGSIANADFDTWFAASILRASTGSVTISGTQTWDFTGNFLKPTGRNIYIPDRNKRNLYQPEIRKAVSENCVFGVALIANPVDGAFRAMNGENLFFGTADSVINIALTNLDCTAVFQNIDGINTTNGGSAITITAEPGGSSGPGTFYDLGNILGNIGALDAAGSPVNALVVHFVSYARDALDVFVGPFDPRSFTQTGAFTAANYAFHMPFAVKRPVTVSGARTYIATQSGNIDVGIYSATGELLTSVGGVACPAAGERTVTFAESIPLVPGTLYYLTFVADNTTVALAIKHGLIATSGYDGPGNYPLPATASPPGNPANENWMWVLT